MTVDPGLPEEDFGTGDKIAQLAEIGDPTAMWIWAVLRAATAIAQAIDGLTAAVERVADSQM